MREKRKEEEETASPPEALPSSSDVPANIPKLYHLDRYQHRRINRRSSDAARPRSSLNKLFLPLSFLQVVAISPRSPFHPAPPFSFIICLSVSVTLHLQSSWGGALPSCMEGLRRDYQASYLGARSLSLALRLVKSFDLNCLHNHFRKSSWEREGFTNGLRLLFSPRVRVWWLIFPSTLVGFESVLSQTKVACLTFDVLWC